jgi:hypothetical protein
MTQAEWLACGDIEPMIDDLIRLRYPDAEPTDWKAGERKKRLLSSACLRRLNGFLPSEYLTLGEMIEQYADGPVDNIADFWGAASEAHGGHADLLFAIGNDDIGLFCFYCSVILAGANDIKRDATGREHASLFRDIFGNPFRPVAADPSWLTSTVLQLAQGIYQDRAFDRLPILADALQDAGCDHDDILNHCRGDGPHVRGCWVVDLLLGRE